MRNREPIIKGLRVDDNGDHFEKMLRKFKKKVENSGRLDDLDKKREYLKPSIVARRAKAKAVARTKREQSSFKPKS
jgi:ribosomal protein S21